MGKELASARATPGRRELALDLTSEEVVLHEGSAAAGWRRFAGVALDDPEFLEVIGLLRAEAERELGDGPVRLWLPAEQVLKLTVRIDADEPQARLAAAFRIAGRETGQGAADLAVALGPAGPSGAAALLVTYAETWREARDYAARWGFVPGPVSTRHHAEDFGSPGPVFVLEGGDGDDGSGLDGSGRERDSDARRHAWVAAGIAALIWATLTPTLVASQAPAAAPVPQVRGVETRGVETRGVETRGVEMRGVETAGTEPVGAVTGSAVEAATGIAAPLPAQRPGRAASSGATGGTALASVASTGVGFLPPPRPSFGIRLDRAALMGVLNLESGREALLRLPGGGFRRCAVGDVLDGWEVTAIEADAMQIRRGAESRTLPLVSR